MADPVLEAGLAGEADRALATATLGTHRAEDIEAQLRGFVQNHATAPLRRVVFFELSVGAVFGLELCDASRVVAKVHQPGVPVERLQAVHQVQAHLHEQGFPAPRPLLGPTRFEGSYAVIDELVDRGQYVDAHEPAVRSAWAELLLRQIELCRALDVHDLGALERAGPPRDRLWPKPHNVLFDFEATSAGAERIDQVAAEAREVLLRSNAPPRIGHSDWSAKHFRYLNGTVTTVYDWDSLRLGGEASIVAGAATIFTVSWYLPTEPAWPTPEESLAFTQDYQAARGRPFSSTEWSEWKAAFIYSSAYGARVGHSVGSAEAIPHLERTLSALADV